MGTAGCLIFNVRDCHTNSGRGVPGRGGGTYSAYALSFSFFFWKACIERTPLQVLHTSQLHDRERVLRSKYINIYIYIYIKKRGGGHPGYKQSGEYARVSLISHGLLI